MRFEAQSVAASTWRLGLTVAVTLVLHGCSLDTVTIPEAQGPSELGLALRIEARPDVLTANGYSTSSITVTAYDQNGRPNPGVDLFFEIADESGNSADIGALEATDGRNLRDASSLGNDTATAVTNGSGVAQVVYRAPARTDLTANTNVIIFVRPVGTDFNGVTHRFIRIELRSAETRLFPQVPGNATPTCSFAIQPATGPFTVGDPILFQSTASDTDGTIVRYEWDFGDGSVDDAPDVAHAYRLAGTYTVTHVCTDDDGAQGAFAATLTVTN